MIIIPASWKNHSRANIAIALSIIALIFGIYQFVKTSRQFHSLNDPKVMLDEISFDTSYSKDSLRVNLLVSNHGSTEALNVKVSARLDMPHDTSRGFAIVRS